MRDRAKQIMGIIIDSLTKQFKSKKPDMQLIAGAIKGLRAILFHFKQDLQSDPKNIQTIYQYLCLTLEPPPHLTRYNIPKAGLKLLSSHGDLFKEYLTEDSEKMYTRLLHFCKFNNPAVRSLAFPAMDVFLSKVAGELVSGARTATADQDTFKFFIRKFHDLVESQTSTMYELTVAIMGYGRFAGPIYQFMGTWELKRLLLKLFQFIDRITNTLEQMDIIHHLASFLSAFANILLILDNVDQSHLENFEKLLSSIFVVYVRLSGPQRNLYHSSLSRLLIALYSKGSLLQQLMNKILLQGIILTCSQAPQAKEVTDNEIEELPLHIQYLDLWKNLLSPIMITDIPIEETQHQQMVTIINDQFISALSNVILKLDLTVEPTATVTDNTTAVTNNNNSTTIKINNSKDYQFFVTLVDFLRQLYFGPYSPLSLKEHYHNWIYLLGKQLISKCNDSPYSIPLYQLLTLLMKIAHLINYFDTNTSETPEAVTDMDLDDNNNNNNNNNSSNSSNSGIVKIKKENKEEVKTSIILFSKFIKEVLVRIQQYKDELLTSCIEFVLSVPQPFIDVKLLIRPLITAFQLGLTIPYVAKIALKALQSWFRLVPSQVTESLSQILPVLNEYLMLPIQPTTGNNVAKKTTKYYKQSKYRTKKNVRKEQDTTSSIQVKIIRFLGKLGGHNVNLIGDLNLTAMGAGTNVGVAWDTVKRIKYPVPWKDIKPDIYIDNILPRVIELSEHSGNRQVKLSACEFLHTIVLYMIGTNAGKRETQQLFNYKKIYDHLFPCIIKLSSDADPVPRQLFTPLIYQLIHWFTKNSTYENEETMCLLDSIVDAGSNVEASIRDISANYLAEFLKWSIKHSSTSNLEKNAMNVKSLLKRLYSLARHPNPYKRLCCSLSLDQMYRTFREEDTLVDVFLFEILHNLMLSLRLTADDDPSLNTGDKITGVIQNYARIVTVKHELLLKPNSKRRQHKSIGDFVFWLFMVTFY